jgi:nucleotide-binding universal stress UspA family protein
MVEENRSERGWEQRRRSAADAPSLDRAASLAAGMNATLGAEVRASRIRIVYGSPAEAILRVAGEGYDLIVMGGHLRAGSVVERVAAGARCPVMTVDRAGERASP